MITPFFKENQKCSVIMRMCVCVHMQVVLVLLEETRTLILLEQKLKEVVDLTKTNSP